MALKFLNKKGWHTGNLRNIENVWKAEQKHEAEQKKLDELRKQIHEEKERQEFRLLQEQAGLVPKQERLDFLYESGLAVGKGSNSDGFKSLETLPTTTSTAAAATEPSSSKEAAAPGALFEDKPHSANDAWRKLHSDPLLIIRQREQQALARVKNNPIQMAMIRKTVEVEKHKDKNPDDKRERKKHRHSKSKRRKVSSPEREYDSESGSPERQRRNHDRDKSSKRDVRSYSEDRRSKTDYMNERDRDRGSKYDQPATKLSEEERAARLREMQQDAEFHEEQRWRRLKKAAEDDALEAEQNAVPSSRNFLDTAQKHMYGAEKGGSSTIEESIRRRTYYSQGKSEIEANAFRR
ncbi:Pre-mRNA-splicing factor CWC25-like protein, partial [Cucurbita argyrosperma subsp. sororia]